MPLKPGQGKTIALDMKGAFCGDGSVTCLALASSGLECVAFNRVHLIKRNTQHPQARPVLDFGQSESD